MKRTPATLLPLILALWACAEGGQRGSGISTTVQGNVASVRTAALRGRPRACGPGLLAQLRELSQIEAVAHARTAIEGIRVAVEGTSAQGETDADGRFLVRGDFDGIVSLVFQLPGDGAARITLNVPAAGTLTMNNVAIDIQQGQVSAEALDVDFEGIITETNCQGLTLTLISVQRDPHDSDQYTLRLDTSSLRDTHGNTLACGELRGGERAMVQGVLNPDGTFGDATVELEQ